VLHAPGSGILSPKAYHRGAFAASDFAVNHDEQIDDLTNDQRTALESSSLHLPHTMIEDLRVKLQVWELLSQA
jgi:hypothetical protein